MVTLRTRTPGGCKGETLIALRFTAHLFTTYWRPRGDTSTRLLMLSFLLHLEWCADHLPEFPEFHVSAQDAVEKASDVLMLRRSWRDHDHLSVYPFGAGVFIGPFQKFLPDSSSFWKEAAFLGSLRSSLPPLRFPCSLFPPPSRPRKLSSMGEPIQLYLSQTLLSNAISEKTDQRSAISGRQSLSSASPRVRPQKWDLDARSAEDRSSGPPRWRLRLPGTAPRRG